MSDDAKLIGERIAHFRRKKRPKLTIARLAELVGVETNTVWRWESGQRLCETPFLNKVAQILGVDENEITGKASVIHIEPNPETVAKYVEKMAVELEAFKKDLASEAKSSLLLEIRKMSDRQARSLLKTLRAPNFIDPIDETKDIGGRRRGR